MAKNKTYFQGLGELANNPELEKFQQNEFAEKLPTEAFLADDKKLSRIGYLIQQLWSKKY